MRLRAPLLLLLVPAAVVLGMFVVANILLLAYESLVREKRP